MIEAKFEIEFNKEDGLTYILSLNDEGDKLYKEITEMFPEQSFLTFILLSPNSMDMVNGNLIYEVDLSYKEEVIKQINNI